MRCQHVCFESGDLEATLRFYGDLLDLKVAHYEPNSLLTFQLEDGFVLRFEYTDKPVVPQGMRFFGLELPTYDAVDLWFDRLQEAGVNIVEDLRPRFKDRPGPYGFLIRDPNGYIVKLFKYGPRE